ncbi:hypothetical protein [Flagellimonas nanhaiensis]|uniref:Uncharacterized protein n=1 Tax=Flagellimonas nanhaiensis TaxID=2292706 RepID=A0A371JP07_9FLAO|nr:hypothetical protein [Allomuricauda nanhaiensis]RDY59249.1 hypothetical protein DX873_07565 [Allomuricauda nanhaiensis]
MTYKIKSLIYFSCFLIACVVYYGIEQENQLTDQINSATLVETEFDDVDEPLDELRSDFEAAKQ